MSNIIYKDKDKVEVINLMNLELNKANIIIKDVPPDEKNGNLGDFYLDFSNKKLYIKIDIWRALL